MKTVVLDCSVVVPWFFPEKESPLVQQVFDNYKNKRIICSAPALLHAEFGNVAWKKVSRKFCSRDHAEAQINMFLKSGIKFYRCDEILSEAFNLAILLKCTVYDALYCALAKVLKAELATLDAHMVEASSDIGIRCFTVG